MRPTLPDRNTYVSPTPHRRAGLLALVLSLALGTCTDQQDPFGAELLPEPQAALVDGNGSGNRYFWLLPPLAPNPRRSGPVDAAVLPSLSVVVCEWSGSACGGQVARFAPGSGSDGIRLEDGGFIVNWKTSNARVGTYRIRFLAAGTELGTADVRVVDNGKDLKGVDPSRYVGVVRNSTLPIKFRVESGAVTVVDPSVGGTVTAPDSPITLSVPPGALSSPVGITLTPLSPSAVPANDAGAPALGAVDLGPDGTTFAVPVTLTMPWNPAELPAGVPAEDLAIYLVDASGAWIELPVTIDLANHTISAQLEHFSRYVKGPAVTRQATLEADSTTTPPATGDTITVRAKGRSAVPTREVQGTKFDFSVPDTTKAKVVSKTDKTAKIVLMSADEVPVTATATGPYVPSTGVFAHTPVRAVQHPASIDLAKGAVTVTVLGGTAYVDVTVRDAVGNPIDGAPYTVFSTAPAVATADTTKLGVRITGGSAAGPADVWVRTTNRSGLPINERIRVTVEKLSPTLSVLATSAPAGGSATLIARMTGGPTKILTFEFEGVQKTATPNPSTGFASATFTVPWAAGSYPITVTLPEDGQVVGTSATGTLTVTKLASTLTLGAMGLTPPGKSVTLSATLAPMLGGGTVSFTVFGQTLTALTDGSGTARVTLTAPGAQGDYPVTASFDGDATRLPSSDTGTLQVGLIPLSFTEFSAAAGMYGSTVTFRATLSSPLSGRKVTFSVPGGPFGSVPSDASGTATLTLNLGTLPAGSHTASATVLSDGVYQGATASTSLNVDPRVSSLMATSPTATYGGAFSASATLTPLLAGQTLSWSLAGGEQLGTAVTGAGGTATLSGTATLTPGSYPGVVAFAGDANHLASQASFTLTVTRRPTSLTVDAASAPYGGAVTLVARFGEAHAGTVTFDVAGTVLGSAQADAQGVATLSVAALPGSLLPGTRTITATATQTATHEGTSATGALTISKLASSLTVDDVIGNYGEMVTLSATVSAPSGAGTPVTFSAGGLTIPATTNASGVATASIKALAPGTITVAYAGGAIHAPTSATGTLTLTTIATSITPSVTADSYPYGTSRTFSGVLSPAVPGAQLSFELDGVVRATIATDASGQAAWTVPATLLPGNHTLVIRFGGALPQYFGSSASIALTVSKLPVTLAALPAAVTWGDPVTLVAEGAAPGGWVNFRLVGVGNWTGARADASGTATHTIDTPAPGSYNWVAWANGDSIYAAAMDTASLIVNKVITTIGAGSLAVNAGQAAMLSVYSNVPGKPVDFLAPDGSLIATVTTDANGSANATWSSMTPGTYTYTVRFNGDAYNTAASGTGTVIVRAATSLSLTGPTNVQVGTRKDWMVQMSPALAGKTITLHFNGEELATSVTDASGIAYFDEIRLWTTGIRLEMIARYAGDATHSPSASMLEVTVNP